jgi:hypothetical protein
VATPACSENPATLPTVDASFSMLFCILSFKVLLPSLKLFEYLSDYISVLIIPATSFFIGYMLIALAFSGIYAYIDMNVINSFQKPLEDIQFNDFLYYSLSSITGFGIYNITPLTTSYDAFWCMS